MASDRSEMWLTSTLKWAVRSLLQRYSPRGLQWIRDVRMKVNAVRSRGTRHRVGTYVGVTGSCGKTSTTSLAASLLEGEGSTRRGAHKNSPGGVYLALANLWGRVDYFVQEISGDRPGLLASVAEVVRPDVAVVTSVGYDHFANFKSGAAERPSSMSADERYRSAIAEEKGSLVAALSSTGIACLNADDELVRAMSCRCKGRVILYGRSEAAEIRAENVSAHWPQRLSFDLVVGESRTHVQTQFVGTLLLSSVLAALSVVKAVGGDVQRAAERLATIEPIDARLSVEHGRDGHTYLLDTVKAPLWQVELLLEDLHNLRRASLVLVLGEVSDVRNDKSKTYRRILRRAAGIADYVIGFGPAASSASKVRGEGHENVMGLETYDQTIRCLAGLPPSLVILKSNKSTRMERIWEAVADRPTRASHAPNMERPRGGAAAG